MLGHASAAMTLDVYSGLFDDDLTALAERMDAASRAAAEARVGAVWARPLTERSGKGKTAAQNGGPRGDRTHNPRIKSRALPWVALSSRMLAFEQAILLPIVTSDARLIPFTHRSFR